MLCAVPCKMKVKFLFTSFCCCCCSSFSFELCVVMYAPMRMARAKTHLGGQPMRKNFGSHFAIIQDQIHARNIFLNFENAFHLKIFKNSVQ